MTKNTPEEADGPEVGGLKGLTADETEAYLEAMGFTSAGQAVDDRAELFKLWMRYGSSFESDTSEGYELADAILTSGWLSAHDAEIRDAALKEAEEAVRWMSAAKHTIRFLRTGT